MARTIAICRNLSEYFGGGGGRAIKNAKGKMGKRWVQWSTSKSNHVCAGGVAEAHRAEVDRSGIPLSDRQILPGWVGLYRFVPLKFAEMGELPIERSECRSTGRRPRPQPLVGWGAG